jgi:xylulokinase
MDSFENAGIAIHEMRAVGGGAKSDRWLQLKADITGKPIVRLDVTESGCLGAAIQAGIACGMYSSIAEAIERLIRFGDRFEPNPVIGEQYSDMYAAYRLLYQQVRPLSKILSTYK